MRAPRAGRPPRPGRHVRAAAGRGALRRSAVAALIACATAAPAAGAPLVSQGAYRIGADALWAQGLLGQGETIAILDEGFAGLERSIARGELPPLERMTLHSEDPLHGWDGINKLRRPTPHGVRMAEIVHDVAPRAHLVLVRYDTPDQFAAAARWVADRGIPVVSHSNSRLTAPFDGSGVYARAVDEAAARGVLWVNSAGNYARRHWRGTATAPVALPLGSVEGDTLLLSLSWSGAVTAELLVQRETAPGVWEEVARGEPDGPVTLVTPAVPVGPGAHRVLVRQTGGAPAELHLFSQTADLGDAAVGESSVATPGDARGALTVGALNWARGTLEPYSSYGPTRDGRPKPEILGPTYITSNAEFPGTAGTSAATPHVAAAALLLRQQRRRDGLPADADSLRAALLATARPVAADGRHGAGLVRLDTVRPTVRIRVGVGRRPVVSVRAADAGSIDRVTIALDGRTLRTARRPAVGVRLPALRRRAVLTITAEDMAGNRIERRRTVVPRRVR